MTRHPRSRPHPDETHQECLRRRLGAWRRTARDVRGPWWAREVGCLVQAGVGITGRYTRTYAKASKKDEGRILGCGLLGHGPEPAQRAQAPGVRSKAPTRSQETGIHGQGPQILLTGALRVLRRVWAASGGQCGKHLKE